MTRMGLVMNSHLWFLAGTLWLMTGATVARGAVPEPSAATFRQEGIGNGMLGGGVANVFDASAMESNPAGLGLNRFWPGYFLGLDAGFEGRKAHAWEASIIDSVGSEIVGGFKVRTTTRATGARTLRMGAGFAEQLQETNLFFGIGGDYTRWRDPLPQESEKPDDDWRFRAGVIYRVSDRLAFGMCSGSYSWTSEPEPRHSLGAAWSVVSWFVLTGDAHFSNSDVTLLTGGGSASLGDSFFLLASYGYDLEAETHGVGGGLAFRAGQTRLNYSVSRNRLDGEFVWHHAVGVTMDVQSAFAGG